MASGVSMPRTSAPLTSLCALMVNAWKEQLFVTIVTTVAIIRMKWIKSAVRNIPKFVSVVGYIVTTRL